MGFDSLLDAGLRRVAERPAWNGALFEHTYKSEKLVFRCAIGLSADGNGGLDNVVNLSPVPHDPEGRIWCEHVDALLAAVVDAVRLPCKTERAREADLVGVICLEHPGPLVAPGEPPLIRLGPGEVDVIRRSLAAPLSVFLDSIPESRETLAARWS